MIYTDYDNVAVVYSCRTTEYIFSKLELVWVLTRSQDPSDEIIAKAKEMIAKRLPDYDQSQSRKTKQGPANSCKYLAGYSVSE